MPDTLHIGLLGPLQVRDGTGRSVHVGGRQLRVLLILLALEAGRVVPAGSLAGHRDIGIHGRGHDWRRAALAGEANVPWKIATNSGP